ncbi:MAG TPA: hypothetical protein P5244_04515 [Syntrophales bacterium]|nr:hypothetical protein [Syntrophales bacterium]
MMSFSEKKPNATLPITDTPLNTPTHCAPQREASVATSIVLTARSRSALSSTAWADAVRPSPGIAATRFEAHPTTATVNTVTTRACSIIAMALDGYALMPFPDKKAAGIH